MNVIFCSDSYLQELNRRFLGHDYCTDVISFDYVNLNTKRQLLGDIFISIDTVRINAKKYMAASFDEELLRVMAHGLFHLLGYKDDSKKEKQIMREREAFAIKLFENHRNEHNI